VRGGYPVPIVGPVRRWSIESEQRASRELEAEEAQRARHAKALLSSDRSSGTSRTGRDRDPFAADRYWKKPGR
jgi:hypothetical protein